MYLGIDLGTSNSAIVGHDGSARRLFKTADNGDVLPSAILVDRRGGMMVGRRAYEQAAFSPENVAQGFKRLMGTSSLLHFAARDLDMTPEAASAEILKALVAQAQMAAGDFTIGGAVVTVPAAFNQMQSEATMRAAEAAGLTKVALLQEPIAAAMASIATSASKDGLFLVYDLGGGTFDVALVQSVGGAATVLAHAGINMLGGRNFDKALVNSLVRPWLLKTFDLPENFQVDARYHRLLRIAQYRAELAKISLSTQLRDRIFADETQIATKDASGAEIYLDVEIARGDLESLIGEEIDRSIELCRTLMASNNCTPSEIDRVVMIGGPSRMPAIRTRVENDLGLKVDLSSDPMTAVAVGAAIYAEGRDWSGSSASSKKSRGSLKLTGPLDIRFDYPERTADARVRIKIRLTGEAVTQGLRVLAETEDGWASGQFALGASTEIRDVPLGRPGPNRVRLTILDPLGSPLPEAGGEITITRTDASAEGMPLMHTLAVKTIEGAVGAEANVLDSLVEKGTLIPRSGVQQFRAVRDMKSGDGTSLDIELFEMAEGVKDPNLNLPIGSFRLSASDLGRGEVIRRGDEIVINWQIDANGLLNCTIEFPNLSRTYDTGKMYVATAGHKNFDGEDGVRLAADALSSAKGDIDQLERALGSLVAADVVALRKRLGKQAESLRLAHEADTRRLVSEEARHIRQDVARLRSRPDFKRAILRAEIDDFMEHFSVELGPRVDAKTNGQINRLAGLAKDALRKDRSDATEEARRSLDEIRALVFSDLVKQPGFWVAMFEDFAGTRHRAIDKARHDTLCRQGEAAIAREDLDALRETIGAMRDNMVKNVGETRVDILAGLMR